MPQPLRGSATRPLFNPPQQKATTKFQASIKEQQWSWADTVNPAGDVDGPAWSTPSRLKLVGIVLTLQTASSVDYTVYTFVDGVSVAGTTIAAGVTHMGTRLGIEADAGVLIYPRLAAAGGGTGTMLGISYRYIS